MPGPYTFPQFVAKFPPVAPPATLGEDTHHVFSRENETLPPEMIHDFIHPTEGDTVEDDEFTEYVPCFAIDNTERFLALVWWKAGLLTYEYVLATFTAKGQLIARRVIAYTLLTENRIRRAVATIDEEHGILIAEGESRNENDEFDPTTSKTYTLEIMDNGEIV
jgi:hypothetical protein